MSVHLQSSSFQILSNNNKKERKKRKPAATFVVLSLNAIKNESLNEVLIGTVSKDRPGELAALKLSKKQVLMKQQLRQSEAGSS